MTESGSTPNKSVSEIMTSDVVTVSAKDSVSKVAEIMAGRKIGSVIVVDGDRVTGILTERDLLIRVLDGKKDPAKTIVADVMSSPVLTVNSETSIYYASRQMEKNFIRRLPVVDSGKLVGIVTQTDLSKALTSAMIDLVPRPEAELKATPIQYSLERGKCYLIEEKKPVKSMEVFVDVVKHGQMGMCLSRTNPQVIRERHGLATTPIIWITDIKTSEPSIDATDLLGISNTISEFVKKVDDGVVFLEAFTYLMGRNDFDRLIRTIQHMRDIISESKSCILIYVDPVVCSEKELELLRQEMDEVKFKAF